MSDTAAASEPTEVEDAPAVPETDITPEPEALPGVQNLGFLTESEGELDADLPEEPVSEPEPTPVAEPTPEEPEPPVGEPVPPVEAEPPAAAEPVQPPVAPVVEPPAPAAPTPQLSQDQLAGYYQQWRGEAEELLATQHYALNEQAAEDLNDNAGEAIPRLMSKVYMDAVTASIGHVMSVLPQAVETALQVRDLTRTNEDAFYGAWPQLDKGQHHDAIVRLGMAYRQVDPNASLETFINNVGAQAIIALKIPMEAAPVEPVIAPVAPFQPAAASPPVATSAQKENPFSALSREMEEEELDLG